MKSSVNSGLIKKAKKGDGQAFGALIQSYERFVYNVVYRITGNPDDAKDVSQEAFIMAFKNFGSYNETWAFSTWLYRIAINTAVDHLRKRKNEISYEDYINEGKESYSVSVEEKVISNESLKYILKAVNTLDEDFKVVIVLKDIEGLDYKEISDIIGCPVGTVKSRLSRARGKLRNIIKLCKKGRIL